MRHLAGRCTFGIAAVLAAAAVCAQTYPAKAVRFVVPFVAGGPTDIQGRLLGEKLAQRLGQQFIIGGTPEQFAAYLKSEVTKFERVVKEAKISAQ